MSFEAVLAGSSLPGVRLAPTLSMSFFNAGRQRRRATFFALLFLMGNAFLWGQQKPAVTNYVRPEIANGTAALLGVLPETTKLELAITLPLRNQAEIEAQLARVQDPSSPDYRKFLSVEQFTERFGPTTGDYNAVIAFAREHGFKVTHTTKNRMLIDISGSVAQINQTFHVTMKLYQHPTESRTFYSADREPSIDPSLPISRIVGLNNYSKPSPKLSRRPAGQRDASNLTGSGPGGSFLGGDMRAAYYPSGTLSGVGQTVALFEIGGYDMSDVTGTFHGASYSVPINNVLIDGASAGSNGDDSEQVLDIVAAISMAPGLDQVLVYIGNSSDPSETYDQVSVDVVNQMATDNSARQLSCSWGWDPDATTLDPIFIELGMQGQTFLTASGDNGAIGPVYGGALVWPADDMYQTGVGATDLTTNGPGGTWKSETAWSHSAGGWNNDGVPIPSWQVGVGSVAANPSSTLRNVPDVAMEGNFDNYVCDQGQCAEDWGGTSFAAPRFAGFLALVNQQAASGGLTRGLGLINPSLYALGASADYDNLFNDIVSGNNNCCHQGGTYWNSVTGYDLVTGWGSPTGQALVDALAPLESVGVSTSPAGLSYSADGTAYTVSQGFTWTSTSTHMLATTTPQAGATGTQYVWQNWSDGGALSHQVTVAGSASYTASFQTQYLLTTNASPTAGGSVTSGTSSETYVAAGSGVQLTAIPTSGYSFTGWTGTITSSSDPLSVTMTGPVTETANFTAIPVAFTTTSLSSSLDPSFTNAPNNGVTFTATVLSSGNPVDVGTVTFTDGSNTIAGCGNAIVSSGQAQCTTSFSAEGSHYIVSNYNGATSASIAYLSSFSSVSQEADDHTVQTGNQWCNTGPIGIPDSSGGATPYPSRIFVTGYTGNVGNVTLMLNDINSSNMPPTDLLLVGPTGAKIVPFANAGDPSTVGSVNITLDDAASSLLPYGSPLLSGTFRPSSMTGGKSLVFPAPAPLLSAANYAAADGTATLASTFNGTPPNGTWELFAMAGAANGAAGITGGWCVNIIPSVTVPNVVGDTQGAADTAILAAGLVVGTTSNQSSNTVPSGDVISQDPLADTAANGGSSVNIVLSTGPQQVAVPNVVGLSQPAASLVINSADLKVGSVAAASSSTVPAGDVISESPTAATEVNVNSAVNLVISTGPAQYLLTTSASPSAGGTVLPLTGQQTANSVVNLKATPAPGYVFAGWTGPVSGATANPTTVTMSGPETVRANFVSALTISPSTINLGTVYLGTLHAKSITLTNTGTTAIKIDEPTLSSVTNGSSSEFHIDNDCPALLQPKSSCSIKVIFTAGARFMPQTAQLYIVDAAPGSPQSVPISVKVIDPVPHFSATSLSFAPQGLHTISSTKTITVTNFGETEVTIGSIKLGGSGAQDFKQTNTCSAVLSKKCSCTIDVKFDPTTSGARWATLTVNDNAEDSQQILTLFGIGK